jgi:hypothetical protein
MMSSRLTPGKGSAGRRFGGTLDVLHVAAEKDRSTAKHTAVHIVRVTEDLYGAVARLIGPMYRGIKTDRQRPVVRSS